MFLEKNAKDQFISNNFISNSIQFYSQIFIQFIHSLIYCQLFNEKVIRKLQDDMWVHTKDLDKSTPVKKSLYRLSNNTLFAIFSIHMYTMNNAPGSLTNPDKPHTGITYLAIIQDNL